MLTAKTTAAVSPHPVPTAALRVYNTLSKTKEPFEPVEPGKVGIYLCGPTVYKPSHIGHMVGPVIFDAVKRYLTYSGYQVKLVINVTDVDDKLIAESTRRNMPMQALAEEMTADYMRNLAAMGIDTVDHFPRATTHIPDIVQMVERLMAQGFAYVSDGDVYFDVAKDSDYGKLSHRSIEALQGEGGSTAERKRAAADFALWKRAKAGEPSWDSPWGPGRPGWHIECSAMSGQLLGETFDIHGGGLDLVFPHHENEIAQSESAHGKPQARYWMHNGLMQSSSEVGKVGGRHTREVGVGDQAAQEAGKIGKSKGAAPFSELLAKYPGETIRFFLLASHYRRPIDYSEERISEVQSGLEKFYRFFERYQRITGQNFYQLPYAAQRPANVPPAASELMRQVNEHRQRFLEFMDDDFNTGGAIGDLFELVGTLNRHVDTARLEEAAARTKAELDTLAEAAGTLRELAATLGLFRQPPAAADSGDDELLGRLVSLFIELRAEARKAKNFA
ncbi:MAG TPA: cysteine--tRNA ligase, partial [Pirellulales bacterium]|nr:cysteine--tRNA ligase [Pirellulales bacterium]